MNDWLTTILIVLPVAGALLVAARAAAARTGSARSPSLISLVEVGFWITAAAKFDFGSPALQFDQSHSWFSDLGVSYHVGQYAFSLWLVGATVVVMAACVIYGWWVGRDRARAYFALMLLADRRDRRRLHRPGPAALLRLLRGDADPALRPDRRLGRRRAGCARRSRSSSTRSSARC